MMYSVHHAGTEVVKYAFKGFSYSPPHFKERFQCAISMSSSYILLDRDLILL